MTVAPLVVPSETPSSPDETASPVASSRGAGATSLAAVGLVLVVLLGVGGGVGLYLTRDTVSM